MQPATAASRDRLDVLAVGRQLRPEDRMVYIQTDAPVNPGNSGGPLVNTEGEVVGINTLILSQSGGSEGLGFAAPSNIVKYIFEEIRDHGRVFSSTTIAPLGQTFKQTPHPMHKIGSTVVYFSSSFSSW